MKSITASKVVRSRVVYPVWMTLMGPLAAVVAVMLVFWLRHIEPVQQVTNPVCGAWMPAAEVGLPFGVQMDSVNAIAAVSNDDVWVVGRSSEFMEDNGKLLFLHWDGTEARIVPHGIPDAYMNRISELAVVSADDIWGVGDYPQMIHWDGIEWKIVNTGISGNLNSISAAAKDDIWAVGTNYNTDGNKPLFIHWDGSAWAKSPEPSYLPSHSSLYDVVAIAPDEAWAVGEVESKDLILRWSGDKWYLIDPVMSQMGKMNLFPEQCGNHYVAISTNATEDGKVWVAGSCSKQSEINKGYGYVSQGLTADIGTEPYQYHIDLADTTGSTHIYEIRGHESSDMWALGAVGEPTKEESAIWHTTGDSWERVQLPNVGAEAHWRSMDMLKDGTLWMAGEAGGRIMLVRFVPSSCPPGPGGLPTLNVPVLYATVTPESP
jgi:hypothetical protein